MKIRSLLLLGLLGLSSATLFAQEPVRPYDPYQVREVVEVPDEIKMVRGDKLRAYKITPDVARAVRVEMPDTLTHYTFEYISPEALHARCGTLLRHEDALHLRALSQELQEQRE